MKDAPVSAAIRLAVAIGSTFVAATWPVANAAPKPADSWAKAGLYHPGMSKEAAKKAGLSDCKEFMGTVECSASTPLQLGGVTSSKSRIELDEKSGRLQKVVFQFPGQPFQAVSTALVQLYGEPTSKEGDYRADDWQRRGYNGCSPLFLWHRGGDDVLVVCGTGGRRRLDTQVIAERVPGRGKEWADVAAARNQSKSKADSFNSK